MSTGDRLFKKAVEFKVISDIALTRDAQEKQLKLLERQEREQTLARIDADEAARRKEEAEGEGKQKLYQLASIEKIHQQDLKIHHEQMPFVEEIALDDSLPLKQAADKFRKRLIDLGLSFYLAENRQSFSAEIEKLVKKYGIPSNDVKHSLELAIKYHSGKTFTGMLEERSKEYRECEARMAKEEADKKILAEKENEKLHPLFYIIVAPLALSFAWWLKPALGLIFDLLGIAHH